MTKSIQEFPAPVALDTSTPTPTDRLWQGRASCFPSDSPGIKRCILCLHKYPPPQSFLPSPPNIPLAAFPSSLTWYLLLTFWKKEEEEERKGTPAYGGEKWKRSEEWKKEKWRNNTRAAGTRTDGQADWQIRLKKGRGGGGRGREGRWKNGIRI